jgi:hypothetical protein
MSKPISKRAATVIAVIAVAGPPSAAVAKPLEENGSPFSVIPPVAQSSPYQPAAHAEQGFEWGDAGVGAAGALVVIGVCSGAVVAVRRRGGHALPG